jgi:hypothetical protein
VLGAVGGGDADKGAVVSQLLDGALHNVPALDSPQQIRHVCRPLTEHQQPLRHIHLQPHHATIFMSQMVTDSSIHCSVLGDVFMTACHCQESAKQIIRTGWQPCKRLLVLTARGRSHVACLDDLGLDLLADHGAALGFVQRHLRLVLAAGGVHRHVGEARGIEPRHRDEACTGGVSRSGCCAKFSSLLQMPRHVHTMWLGVLLGRQMRGISKGGNGSAPWMPSTVMMTPPRLTVSILLVTSCPAFCMSRIFCHASVTTFGLYT